MDRLYRLETILHNRRRVTQIEIEREALEEDAEGDALASE